MYQGGVAFTAHGFDHAERGEGIDEGGCAVGGSRSGREEQTLFRRYGTVLRVHGAAEHRDGLALERARGRGGTGLDHHARAFVAHRHGDAEAGRHAAQRAVRNTRRHTRTVGRGVFLDRFLHVGAGEQQAEIRWIDGGRVDPHQHFVVLGNGNRHLRQRYLEFAAAFDQGAKLQGSASVRLGHVRSDGWLKL